MPGLHPASRSSSGAPLRRSEQLGEVVLGEQRDARLLRLRDLRPWALADDDAGRLLRDVVADLRAELLQPSLRLLPRPALERAGDDVGAAGQRAFLRPLLLADLEPDPEFAQLGDERAVALLGEPLR